MINGSELPKVSMVGAGNVGSTCAFLIAINSVADIYIFDKFENLAKAKALDIGQAAAAFNSRSKVIAGADPSEMAGSDVVIITAGMPRKPGMTRQDLIKINSEIALEVSANIKKYSPDSVVIVVSNPLDILTYLVLKDTGFERRKVFGMAGLVDNSRLRYFSAQEANVDVGNVSSHVLGVHADQMVIPQEHLMINSKPASQSLSLQKIKNAKDLTKNAGAQIVSLLGNGSAYYMPGTGAYLMAKAVLTDSDEEFDTCAYLEGEYGINDVCLGVAANIGSGGIKKINEIDLSKEAHEKLIENAKIIKEQLQLI